MFAGTSEQFHNHVGVAEALDALDRRDLWLLVSVIGGRPTDPTVFTEIAAAVRQLALRRSLVDLLDDPDFPAPETRVVVGGLRVLVRGRRRAVKFRSDEFPLVANPLAWTGNYELDA